MELLPAIDLLGGRAVRLAKGDYAQVTVYSDDPVAQALEFAEQGANWLHVVDLDGAKTGIPTNVAIVAEIIKATGLNVEVGGGLRSLEAIERVVVAGAKRVVLGTKLVTDPDFCKSVIAQYGELVCAGVDAHGGEVKIAGWIDGGGISAAKLVGELKGWGVEHLVYTDIARDGMQTGIDAQAYEAVAAAAGFAVTASGGVSTLDDLRALAALGDDVVEAVIAGRAIYEGAFSVSEAANLLKGLS